MLANISIPQLRCLAAVAETQGFTAAASRLGLTQSAVSQAVGAVEAGLGVTLFRRGRDGVIPTQAGETALVEVRAALAAIERLAACSGGADLAGARLRLGAVQSAAIRLVPGWLRQFRARYPKVAVSLYEGNDPEVRDWALAGAIDIGITNHLAPGLVARTVAEDQYVVLLPPGHRLGNRREATLADLDGDRMVMSGGGCETMIEELLGLAGSRPEIVCMVRDNTTLIAMVREGLGFTILPELALSDAADLTALRLRPNLRRKLHVVTRETAAQEPAVRAFLALLP